MIVFKQNKFFVFNFDTNENEEIPCEKLHEHAQDEVMVSPCGNTFGGFAQAVCKNPVFKMYFESILKSPGLFEAYLREVDVAKKMSFEKALFAANAKYISIGEFSTENIGFEKDSFTKGFAYDVTLMTSTAYSEEDSLMSLELHSLRHWCNVPLIEDKESGRLFSLHRMIEGFLDSATYDPD